ncbi:hypothetical protein Droror1_Dr00027701 [Drosera rotundifolia]
MCARPTSPQLAAALPSPFAPPSRYTPLLSTPACNSSGFGHQQLIARVRVGPPQDKLIAPLTMICDGQHNGSGDDSPKVHAAEVSETVKNVSSGFSPLSPAVKDDLILQPKRRSPFSMTNIAAELSALLFEDLDKKSEPEINSYLLYGRIKVYSCIPDLQLQKGVTIMPIIEKLGS